jgi:hypothetical protein
MKGLLKNILIGVSIIALGFWFLLRIAANETKKDIKLYNNGICSKCGGTYEYSQAIGHKYETNYIYICNSCNNLIETDHYYREDD